MKKVATIVLVMAGLSALALCDSPTTAEVSTGIFDPCSLTAEITGGPYCWVICPHGDGAALSALSPAPGDATILVTVKNETGAVIPGVPAADFWLIGCGYSVSLCGGSGAINADGASDANGQTTISGALSGGGCDAGVSVVVQGFVVLDPDCAGPLCLDIAPHSPDGDGDNQVISIDFGQFGNAWEPLGGVYDPCMDFDCSGTINSIDFSVFGNHWQHACL